MVTRLKKSKPFEDVRAILPLYRVDYFRGPIAGACWTGKEYFTASSMEHARALAKARAVRLGVREDVHSAE